LADVSVLVIEDDPAVSEVLAGALEARGYRVRAVSGGREALEAVAVDAPDLVLLDLGLPDIDGIEVCRRLREWSANPILVLSADGAEDRKIAALDQGADDYVTKPFSMPELLARLRVAARHRHLAAMVVDDTVIVVGDVVIDIAARAVRVGDTAVDVARKEFDLLALLARNAGKVLTHGAILDQVWGRGQGATESLRVHVTQLRRKLGTGPHRPRLTSAPGTGYRLVVPEPARP
jgi:two-component system KDP operon response regulator KdpE